MNIYIPRKVLNIALALAALTLLSGLSFVTMRGVSAQSVETYYYYSDVVLTDEFGGQTKVPRLWSALEHGESWASAFQVGDVYILRLTTTRARHNELDDSFTLLGHTLAEAHDSLTSVQVDFVRDVIQQEYDRLDALGCRNLPLDPVEIVGKGDIDC